MTDETQETEQVTEESQPEALGFSPKDVEQKLLEIAHERSEDPVETAASTYTIYMPYFQRQLPKLSTRALRRLVEFLVMYPLIKQKPGATSEIEREMMELTNTLVQAKFVMQLGTLSEHAETLYNAANSPLTEQEAAEVIAQLKAGGASDEDIAAIHENKLDNSVDTSVV